MSYLRMRTEPNKIFFQIKKIHLFFRKNSNYVKTKMGKTFIFQLFFKTQIYYANRAMAYLRMRPEPNYIAALKDCQSVDDIWEFMDNQSTNKSILLFFSHKY